MGDVLIQVCIWDLALTPMIKNMAVTVRSPSMHQAETMNSSDWLWIDDDVEWSQR